MHSRRKRSPCRRWGRPTQQACYAGAVCLFPLIATLFCSWLMIFAGSWSTCSVSSWRWSTQGRGKACPSSMPRPERWKWKMKSNDWNRLECALWWSEFLEYTFIIIMEEKAGRGGYASTVRNALGAFLLVVETPLLIKTKWNKMQVVRVFLAFSAFIAD